VKRISPPSFLGGVAQDYAWALYWYRKAAEQGDATAQGGLGAMYSSGQGVARDDAEAIRWFRKAAEQGDGTAQLSLGVKHQQGFGVA
jgi:TPR repeat protein